MNSSSLLKLSFAGILLAGLTLGAPAVRAQQTNTSCSSACSSCCDGQQQGKKKHKKKKGDDCQPSAASAGTSTNAPAQ